MLDACLSEMERLLEHIQEARAKSLQATGLPAHVRGLRRMRASVDDAMAQVAAAPDAAALTLLARRLEACSVHASQCHVQWQVLKRCRAFAGIGRSFQGSDRDSRKREVARVAGLGPADKQRLHRLLKEQARVDVDLVGAEAEWLVVRTLRQDRLARHMADCGWGWGEHALGDDVDACEWDEVPLAKLVRRLVAAASINRHEYRIPRVRLVLPNIRRGASDDVCVLLDQLSRLDAAVEVRVEDGDGAFLATPPPRLETALEQLVGGEFEGLTPSLNLDHSVLVDLISDITHAPLEPQPWQQDATRAQIMDEGRHAGGVMARVLYPVLEGRRLECTREAAEHLDQMLRTVGTGAERERGRLLVTLGGGGGRLSEDAARRRFQELSMHALPAAVQIPVRVVDARWDWPSMQRAVSDGRLPAVALDVARRSGFSRPKLSTYMHGWATGTVTVTSNKEIRGQLRALIEAHRHGDGDCGPPIWRLDAARNLLAKSAAPRGQGSSSWCSA